MPKILVAGLRNKYMGDDGFGPRVIEAPMVRNLHENVEARDVGLCGVTLAPDLRDYELVIFVDAVQKGGKPGTIYRSEIKAKQWRNRSLKNDELLLTQYSRNKIRRAPSLRQGNQHPSTYYNCYWLRSPENLLRGNH